MTKQTVTHLAVEQLNAHPGNIRTNLGDLSELAASIYEHGILQPLTVTEDPRGGWLLIAGHRRLAAATMARLDRVPVIIRHGVEDETTQMVLMLVENVQRQSLSAVEKAQAYGALRNRGLSTADISRKTGISASTISTHLALLELDDDSLDSVREGTIAVGDALAAVRETRQTQRATSGAPQRGRPVVAEPAHFGGGHPLLPFVNAICDHSTRPRVGNTACGQCWEAVIRADALGQPMPEGSYDEAVVQRIFDGATNVQAQPPDRVEVVRRWRAAGLSLNELGIRTGWKVDRYALPERDMGEAS